MNGQISQDHMDLISRIYDLPLQPERWQDVLDEFSHVVNASIAGIAAYDPVYIDHYLNVVTSNFGPSFMQDYQKQVSPGYQSAFAKMMDNPRRTFLSDMDMLELSDIEQYKKRPVMQWLRQNHKLFHGAAACLNPDLPCSVFHVFR